MKQSYQFWQGDVNSLKQGFSYSVLLSTVLSDELSDPTRQLSISLAGHRDPITSDEQVMVGKGLGWKMFHLQMQDFSFSFLPTVCTVPSSFSG